MDDSGREIVPRSISTSQQLDEAKFKKCSMLIKEGVLMEVIRPAEEERCIRQAKAILEQTVSNGYSPELIVFAICWEQVVTYPDYLAHKTTQSYIGRLHAYLLNWLQPKVYRRYQDEDYNGAYSQFAQIIQSVA